MMLEHIDHISETAASAIANIKFDKVVVWVGGTGKDGSSSTANFVRSLAGALPPALTMMRDIGGIEMPESLGKLLENLPGEEVAADSAAAEEEADSAAPAAPKPPRATPPARAD
jgi:flotillin